MKREFEEFMGTAEVSPPQSVSDGVRSQIYRELNPSPLKVFARMGMIHLIAGVVTLTFCPQFGVRLLGDGMGIVIHFAWMGTYLCTALCGFIFLSLSIGTATLVLRPEELRTIRKHEHLQIASLVLLSLGVFVMAEAEILLVFGLVWAIGSFIGGVAALELGCHFRRLMPAAGTRIP